MGIFTHAFMQDTRDHWIIAMRRVLRAKEDPTSFISAEDDIFLSSRMTTTMTVRDVLQELVDATVGKHEVPSSNHNMFERVQILESPLCQAIRLQRRFLSKAVDSGDSRNSSGVHVNVGLGPHNFQRWLTQLLLFRAIQCSNK